MSDLDRQIRVLIDDAPSDGVTPQLVEAIAPLLKQIAAKLRHSQYYILQNLAQDWVLITLSHQAKPELEKAVIYAFPTLQDVSTIVAAEHDPQVIAAPIPVTHILFQLIALENVDSIVFLETPGNPDSGIEVRRHDLQNLIQLQLKQNLTQPNIPPDIA